MSAEDPQDIKLELEKKCLTQSCNHLSKEYLACCDRIKDVPFYDEPHCFPQYFQVIHCVDVCVDKDLWPTLK